ncbi:MAG TPA: DUF4365 domain-containing protein [Gemmatimonadaceae bacterium]
MPLPENHLKELLSRGFLRLVASHAGFIAGTDELDFGTDITLSHVSAVAEAGDRIRYAKTGFAIEVQLKATCERQIEVVDGSLKYNLRSSNYNDLVRRASGQIPLVLVLFVLPDDPASWLGIADSELTLRRCGYIWRPAAGAEAVENIASKRISIPLTNRLDTSSFEALRQEYIA